MAHQEELRKFADEEQAARQEAMVTTEAQVRPTKEIVATIQLNRFRARARVKPPPLGSVSFSSDQISSDQVTNVASDYAVTLSRALLHRLCTVLTTCLRAGWRG